MPTQEENAPPWPPCENLFARPCSPPLCVRRPPRIPMSGFAPPEESVFPATAPSMESSNPISFVVLLVCWFGSEDRLSKREFSTDYGRHCPLAAALSPSLIASASFTYLPFLVLP